MCLKCTRHVLHVYDNGVARNVFEWEPSGRRSRQRSGKDSVEEDLLRAGISRHGIVTERLKTMSITPWDLRRQESMEKVGCCISDWNQLHNIYLTWPDGWRKWQPTGSLVVQVWLQVTFYTVMKHSWYVLDLLHFFMQFAAASVCLGYVCVCVCMCRN